MKPDMYTDCKMEEYMKRTGCGVYEAMIAVLHKNFRTILYLKGQTCPKCKEHASSIGVKENCNKCIIEDKYGDFVLSEKIYPDELWTLAPQRNSMIKGKWDKLVKKITKKRAKELQKNGYKIIIPPQN